MKKHLIAAAVAAAVAVPAMAQNVSVSGVVDVGMGRLDTGATTNATRTSGTSNGLTTSNIKFSGSEDLGGGLKAIFTLTQEFSPATGALSGQTDNRVTQVSGTTTKSGRDVMQETSVGLAGNFGSIKIGKFNHNAREAFGVGRLSGNLGRIDSTLFRTLGNDVDNSIAFTSASLSGFTFDLTYGGKETGGPAADATVANATDATYANYKTVSGALRYSSGPLNAAVSRINRTEVGTKKREGTHFGVDYDFGMAKVGLIYAVNDPSSDAANDETNVTSVSAVIPFAGGVALHVNFAEYDADAANSGASAYALAITKDLSKRTTLYTSYGKTKNDSGVRIAHGGSGARSATNGDDPSALTVGIRHSF